jgi:hypothetical protein
MATALGEGWLRQCSGLHGKRLHHCMLVIGNIMSRLFGALASLALSNEMVPVSFHKRCQMK